MQQLQQQRMQAQGKHMGMGQGHGMGTAARGGVHLGGLDLQQLQQRQQQ